MKVICNLISRWMAVIIILAALVALVFPGIGTVVRTSWVNWMLGIVMLGMGLMLRFEDFRVIFQRPRDVLLGILMQFALMPLIGWVLVQVFALPPELAVGVILVGCCPGGTASNVITFLAGGDLALSVGMTCVSTLLAPFVTPLLVWLLAGKMVDVDVVQMFLSIVQVVILPILIGILMRRFAPKMAEGCAPYLPAVSVVAIAMIVIAVVSANQPKLLTSGWMVILIVILHNAFGFLLGYGIAWALHLVRPKRIALSIEVGMQNSGLACSLAGQHFPTMAMASVPGAVFSVWHNVAGAVVARIFRK